MQLIRMIQHSSSLFLFLPTTNTEVWFNSRLGRSKAPYILLWASIVLPRIILRVSNSQLMCLSPILIFMSCNQKIQDSLECHWILWKFNGKMYKYVQFSRVLKTLFVQESHRLTVSTSEILWGIEAGDYIWRGSIEVHCLPYIVENLLIFFLIYY